MPERSKAPAPFDVAAALRARQVTYGSWIQLASPGVAEILANAEYDWIGLDCEHTAADIATVEAVARAVYGRGSSLLVRVSRCDTVEIRKCLDVGAHGVIVPLVETVEEAERAVAAAKYPPRGVRGFCFGRMNNWGVDFDSYVKEANDRVAVVLMIESKTGVENVEKIAAVPGVDGLFIGPYDLSGSYGVPGETGHPLVQEARLRVVEAARKAGISSGQHLVRSTPEIREKAVADGLTFICLDGDIIFLEQAARTTLQTTEKK